MFDSAHMWQLLKDGWLSNIPLTIGSILTLSIFFERLWKFRGLEEQSRDLASRVIDRLLARDLDGAKQLCEESDTQVAEMMAEGLRWKNINLEDLERVFATLRAEIAQGLRKGTWIIGTTGSLAPFVGLFGTVVGIIRAFGQMAESGGGGFAVVAASLSEALVATAFGLGVAIIALMFFNYLNIRIQALNGVNARASERVVQALLYVESNADSAAQGGAAGGAAGGGT
jgi:biopolymer transport protein ExbB